MGNGGERVVISCQDRRRCQVKVSSKLLPPWSCHLSVGTEVEMVFPRIFLLHSINGVTVKAGGETIGDQWECCYLHVRENDC